MRRFKRHHLQKQKNHYLFLMKIKKEGEEEEDFVNKKKDWL